MKIYADLKKTPEWILDYVSKVVSLLGMEEWDLGVDMSLAPVPGQVDVMGICQAFPDQNQCIITLRLDIENAEDGRRYVLHELLHVWHSHVDTVVDQLIMPRLTGETADMARDAYDLAYESFVARMTDRLYPLVETAIAYGESISGGTVTYAKSSSEGE